MGNCPMPLWTGICKATMRPSTPGLQVTTLRLHIRQGPLVGLRGSRLTGSLDRTGEAPEHQHPPALSLLYFSPHRGLPMPRNRDFSPSAHSSRSHGEGGHSQVFLLVLDDPNRGKLLAHTHQSAEVQVTVGVTLTSEQMPPHSCSSQWVWRQS
jgi:hypothetical protein